jgi:hypothetical protein
MPGWHSESVLHRVLTPCVTLNEHCAYTEEHRLTPIEPKAYGARKKVTEAADRRGFDGRHSIATFPDHKCGRPLSSRGRCSSSEDPSLCSLLAIARCIRRRQERVESQQPSRQLLAHRDKRLVFGLDFTCPVTALIRHVDNFRMCSIRPKCQNSGTAGSMKALPAAESGCYNSDFLGLSCADCLFFLGDAVGQNHNRKPIVRKGPNNLQEFLEIDRLNNVRTTAQLVHFKNLFVLCGSC